MPIFIEGARLIGADFHCHLVEYMRTIIYRIPSLKVKAPWPAACTILHEQGFRASVVVDPFAYLRGESVSDQFEFEDNFQTVLSEKCPSPTPDSEPPLYLVVQFKEDLNPFDAVDGQCRRIPGDGAEAFILVECGEPYTPNPNERRRTINAVLTAVRGEFGITDGIKPCFNTRCYRADSGQCVFPIRFEFSEPTVQVTSPIKATEVTERASAAASLVTQIENSFQTSNGGTQVPRGPDFTLCLGELLEALQLDETRDHAYWRLWYLQLFDRLEKFGKQCRPHLQVGNQDGLEDEKYHRNLIAHRGVDKIDGTLLCSVQTKAIRIINRKT